MFAKNTERIKFFAPVLLVAIIITMTGLYFHQNFFRILPLYVSLFVMGFSAKVNKYAFLLGSLNSILYAVIYFSYTLYGMAAYALVFSFPMQLITFIRWQRHSYKQSVRLKKMTAKEKIIAALIFSVAWLVLFLVIRKTGASYALLDNTVTMFGILISILQMLAFVEYTYLMIPSSIFSIALYIQMLPENPEQATYLIYSIYSFICMILQFKNAIALYKVQNAEKEQA